MNISEELLALIIATLIGVVPNIILKWMEQKKPEQELSKTTIESADISLDMVTEALKTSREHVEFLDKRLDRKNEEIQQCREKIRELEDRLKELEKE